MSRSNYDKPIHADGGTSIVTIRMNMDVKIGKPLRNCDVGTDEKQETVEDIVAEMRSLGRLDERSTDKIPRSLQALGLRTYADRIEAAEKRERDATREKSSQVGNAAKMRAALEDAEKVLDDSSHSMCGIPPHMNDLLARIRAALSAPPRNCDKFKTAEEFELQNEVLNENI